MKYTVHEHVDVDDNGRGVPATVHNLKDVDLKPEPRSVWLKVADADYRLFERALSSRVPLVKRNEHPEPVWATYQMLIRLKEQQGVNLAHESICV